MILTAIVMHVRESHVHVLSGLETSSDFDAEDFGYLHSSPRASLMSESADGPGSKGAVALPAGPSNEAQSVQSADFLAGTSVISARCPSPTVIAAASLRVLKPAPSDSAAATADAARVLMRDSAPPSPEPDPGPAMCLAMRETRKSPEPDNGPSLYALEDAMLTRSGRRLLRTAARRQPAPSSSRKELFGSSERHLPVSDSRGDRLTPLSQQQRLPLSVSGPGSVGTAAARRVLQRPSDPKALHTRTSGVQQLAWQNSLPASLSAKSAIAAAAPRALPNIISTRALRAQQRDQSGSPTRFQQEQQQFDPLRAEAERAVRMNHDLARDSDMFDWAVQAELAGPSYLANKDLVARRGHVVLRQDKPVMGRQGRRALLAAMQARETLPEPGSESDNESDNDFDSDYEEPPGSAVLPKQTTPCGTYTFDPFETEASAGRCRPEDKAWWQGGTLRYDPEYTNLDYLRNHPDLRLTDEDIEWYLEFKNCQTHWWRRFIDPIFPGSDWLPRLVKHTKRDLLADFYRDFDGRDAWQAYKKHHTPEELELLIEDFGYWKTLLDIWWEPLGPGTDLADMRAKSLPSPGMSVTGTLHLCPVDPVKFGSRDL